MEGIQFAVQAQSKLSSIKTKDMPIRGKILLLENLKTHLKNTLASQKKIYSAPDLSKFESTTLIS